MTSGSPVLREFWIIIRWSLRIAIALCAVAVSGLAEESGVVTVWLIPAENTGPADMAPGEEIRSRVDRFNEKFEGTPITVLNTTDPVLKMKLVSWNPAFAVPNAAVVTTQMRTLGALQTFARNNDAKVRVRFVTWDEAFSLISELNPNKKSPDDPDVVQIGSTWGADLVRRGLVMSRPGRETDRGNWKDVLDSPASALPYITDVRLLFYWKRLPPASPSSRELVLNTSSWSAVIESIRDRASSADTIAFPSGLTLNVLHDYAPLVWAGGGLFVESGWYGQRVDLTSSRALAVPELLQQRALDMVRPGEPRRLIAFPESTHEEVARIFVNGGYRVTQEPANFIGRWLQDFEQRHQRDGLHFWDYADAAVPPKAFRGGSELIVLRGGRNPHVAFALADYLAGDPYFTEVLAKAGHLPAGRRGYGLDILAKSLSPTDHSEPDVERFVDGVQKAIEQGVSYPQLASWPTAVESRQVQEALQLVWRRMGEGDPEGLYRAAKDAEWLINTRINWAYDLTNAVIQARWAVAILILAAIATATYLAHRRAEAQRRVVLLLYLYRAHRHDAAKFLGDNFYGLSMTATRENWSATDLNAKVSALSLHFKNNLVPHIENIAENQFAEMNGTQLALRLGELVDTAYDGARYIYEAKETTPLQYIQYAKDELDNWAVTKFPHALLVVLEEWFLNSIAHIIGNQITDPVILVGLHDRELFVDSSGKMNADRLDVLNRPAEMEPISSTWQGIPLIRNIVYYAYGVRVVGENLTSQNGRPLVRLRIPLRGTLKRYDDLDRRRQRK